MKIKLLVHVPKCSMYMYIGDFCLHSNISGSYDPDKKFDLLVPSIGGLLLMG